jgi:hypothetical protein
MKFLLACALLTCCVVSPAAAKPMNKTVASGKPTIVAHYFTWNKDCTGAFGVVKVVSPPQHGTISRGLVDWTIGESRREGGTDQCFGKPIKALAVTYKSEAGYHGTDTFTLDATFRAYHDVDTFTVTVQ